MNQTRGFAAGSFISLDEWWITGGNGDEYQSTEILNSGKSAFQNYVDLPQALYYHTMVNINETSVAIFSGQSTYDSVYLFDKNTQSFTNLPSLNQGRQYAQGGTNLKFQVEALDIYIVFVQIQALRPSRMELKSSLWPED